MNGADAATQHPSWCAEQHDGARHRSRPWIVWRDGEIQLRIEQAPMFDSTPVVVLTVRQPLDMVVLRLSAEQATAVNGDLTSVLMRLAEPDRPTHG